MAAEKVYLVVEKVTGDYNSDTTINVFAKYEDANNRFKEIVNSCIEDEKEWYDHVEYDEKNGNFEAYEMGDEAYSNHYVYTLIKTVL